MQPIYLVAGSPGSGKSWVCEQLTDIFHYIPHDDYINKERSYHDTLKLMAKSGNKPVLTETPFSVSTIKEKLERSGFPVITVFIVEPPEVLAKRYQQRKGEEIPKGHLTRQETYKSRSKEWRCFCGTSSEVLTQLKTISKYHGT